MSRMPLKIGAKKLKNGNIEIRYDISKSSEHKRADNAVQEELKKLVCNIDATRNDVKFIEVPQNNFKKVRKFLLDNGVDEVRNDSASYEGPNGKTCFPKLEDLKIADLKNKP